MRVRKLVSRISDKFYMIPQRRKRKLNLKGKIQTVEKEITVSTIVDLGCTTSSISKKLVDEEGLPT